MNPLVGLTMNNELIVTRVANGFMVKKPRRGDYDSPADTHVFPDAGLLAAWVKQWASDQPELDPKPFRDDRDQVKRVEGSPGLLGGKRDLG